MVIKALILLVFSLEVAISTSTTSTEELYTDGGIAVNNTQNDISDGDGRIINGVVASRGQFPWQVAINYKIGTARRFCGGALISNQWVLTAAHCLTNGHSFEVSLGATRTNQNEDGKIVVGVERTISHPNFNRPSNLNNDVAVMKLRAPVQFNNYIRPIKLAAYNSYLQPNTNVVVSGWGQTSDQQSSSVNVLYSVALRTISNQQCRNNYKASLVLDNVVCCDGSGFKGTCYGDSGGALVGNINGVWIHVGVVSFVDTRGCALGYPSGFARTGSFLDFIYQNTGLRP